MTTPRALQDNLIRRVSAYTNPTPNDFSRLLIKKPFVNNKSKSFLSVKNLLD